MRAAVAAVDRMVGDQHVTGPGPVQPGVQYVRGGEARGEDPADLPITADHQSVEPFREAGRRPAPPVLAGLLVHRGYEPGHRRVRLLGRQLEQLVQRADDLVQVPVPAHDAQSADNPTTPAIG